MRSELILEWDVDMGWDGSRNGKNGWRGIEEKWIISRFDPPLPE